MYGLALVKLAVEVEPKTDPEPPDMRPGVPGVPPERPEEPETEEEPGG